MMERLPKQNPGILVRRIGHETMLYDTNRGMVHILNATAEAVWECCDGKTLINKVEQKLKDSCSLAHDIDIKDDIREIISHLSQMDLLCTVP